MPRRKKDAPPKGSIRRRGNSFQVSVYTGFDPVTGRRLYVTKSTTNENEAERILARLCAEVDTDRYARTRGTLRVALDDWLSTTELEASTRHTYEMYARKYINPALGSEPIARINARVLERLYADLRRCRQRCDGKPFVEHREEGPHECRTVRHRRPPGRQPAGGYPEHDCDATGCKVVECLPHECKPLAKATVVKIHHMLSGTFAAAIRWEWITTNPADVARPPRQPAPQPSPPTVDEAGRIATAAWEQDETWGTLVWLVMVTGLRRAELLALRWRDIDLGAGTLEIRRSYSRAAGKAIEKDTKTHRLRRMSLDPATVEVLTEHYDRYSDAMRKLGVQPSRDAFLFSYETAFDRPYSPDWVTHRYTKMCTDLGIDSHLHALRHYSATELLTAGVDLRTVAGRLGHGGGGATTLRVYAAWVGESDRRAADILGSRMKRPERGR